ALNGRGAPLALKPKAPRCHDSIWLPDGPASAGQAAAPRLRHGQQLQLPTSISAHRMPRRLLFTPSYEWAHFAHLSEDDKHPASGDVTVSGREIFGSHAAR